MKKFIWITFLLIATLLNAYSISLEEEYDSLYKDLRHISTPGYKATLDSTKGKSLGLPILEQGSLTGTKNNIDIAVAGNGFFKVLDEEGNIFYTRFGNFRIDENFRLLILCKNKKYFLPVKSLHETFLLEEIRIYRNGTIESKYYVDYSSKLSEIIGRIEIYDIPLENIESYDGFVIKTKTQPEKATQSEIISGFLEQSNIDLDSTLLRMLFILEQLDESQIKQKDTKRYLIKQLLDPDVKHTILYGFLASPEIENFYFILSNYDRYTLFLDRLYE